MEVLPLGLEALSLPLTGSKVQLVSHLKDAVQAPHLVSHLRREMYDHKASKSSKTSSNCFQEMDTAANKDASEVFLSIGSMDDLDEP